MSTNNQCYPQSAKVSIFTLVNLFFDIKSMVD